ncbi:hybrid sensor histidine kinase/response regulator [Mucilaginibacter sp. PAMC 26640]|nr:hybrid sensor histidine kinase/response regulator [Mucilaginibacter sp. PAMC 26640]
MPEKITILYLDDEHNNLVGFKASFRMDYRILTAVNVPEALKLLEANPEISIIFCDQRMPGITGIDFFEEIIIKYPLPVRIMITAFTDVEEIIDAINKGNIFRFVKKPWNEAEIRGAISEASKFYLANSMLSIKNQELERAYAELNKFAYSVSHDIRGPLSGILGAINLAHEIDDIAEIRNMMSLMKKSVNKMDAYVLSMHDYYRLQRGELKISEIDFNIIAGELKAIFNVIAQTNSVAFNITTHISEVFRSDKMLLLLILNNLLSNAFKYQNRNSNNKSVEVMIEVKHSTAKICIKDTGVGIISSHIEEIFKLFYRSKSVEVGSGLGLYNVKSALTKLNGQIEVDSVLGEGSTFMVTIPSI